MTASNLASQEEQLQRARMMATRHAIAAEELVCREQATRAAREQLARAQGDYDLLQAGAWEADKAVSRAAVTPGESEIKANPRARSAKLRSAERTHAPAWREA